MSEAVAARAGDEPLIIGRYALFDAVASGGMATVHLGRLLGPEGFGRTVAVKRLHAHYTTDPEFVTMFMDEAGIVARIRHPNVVPMMEIIQSSKGVFLIMEYVHGESLSKLLRTCRAADELLPIALVNAIVHGVLLGLHAAHDTKDAHGELLNVVHRDVSPQNIIVGADGIARVLDFGVAKAAGRAQITREGQIKGKLAYMAPEQIRGHVDRRADVFAASVVLWEALAGRRLHDGAKDVDIVTRVVRGAFDPPSKWRPGLPPELDAIVMRGLSVNPDERYASALEMARDLERTAIGLAPPSAVATWVGLQARDALHERASKVIAMERASSALSPSESSRPPSSASLAVATPSEASRPSESHVRGRDEVEVTARMAMTDFLPSHTSTTTGAEAQVRTSRTSGVLIAVLSFVVALVVVGGAAAAWSLSVRRTARPPAGAPAAAAITAPPPSVSVVAAPAEPASAEPAVAEPIPSPSASSAAAKPQGTKPAPRTRAAAPSNAPVASPKKNCDPPFSVDDSGRRKYKLECMPPE